MIFSIKHFVIFAVGLLPLLQNTLARPLYPLSDDGLILRETYEDNLVERKFTDIDARSDLLDDLFPELERRQGRGQIKKEVKANPYTKKGNSKLVPPVKATPKPANRQKGLPNKAKLTLSKSARKELDGLGLHGKARKNTIKWHKDQVKQQMKTNSALKGKARTGVIQHIAHKGGSHKYEKNHITASFKDKDRKAVPNSFNGGENHHLYMNNGGLPRQAKAASDKNDANLKGKSKKYQVSIGKTRSEGKSSKKGKGKQNPDRGAWKNPKKGLPLEA